MVELLPAKFAGSSEISVAGILSLKIQDAAEASGNAELASIINGLTEEEIKRLISLGRGPLRLVGSNSNLSGTLDSYVIPLTDYSIWKSLEDRGLVQSTQDLNDYEGFFYSLNPTKGYSNTLRIPVSDLTKEQTDKLLDNDVELTDLGYKAYNIIIKIIADSIGIK